MAHRSDLDLVKEATSTTGTGTLTLAGAVSGYVGVCDATNGLLADGDTGWFVARNGGQWEMFLGTRGGGGTTLARTTRIKSSTGAAISFSSAPTVYGVIPGTMLVGPGGPAFSAYRATSNQAVTTGTLTKVQLNAEEYDLGGCFDSSTNYRFTPNVPGYYQLNWCVRCDSATTSITDAAAVLYKNGASIKSPEYVGAAASSIGVTGSALVYMNGTTDYVEIYTYIAGTSPRAAFGSNLTFFSGYLARPA